MDGPSEAIIGSSPKIIRWSTQTGTGYHKHTGNMKNTYKSMLENPKRNRSLEIPRNKSEYNIKIHLREIQ
jgi:hypothetical protein